MATEKRTKQQIIYAGLAVVIALAFAVSLVQRDQTRDRRATSAISEFIILSAAPDPRGVDFLSRARVQRENRAERLAHVQPGVIAAYARALGMAETALRFQIGDPDQTGPFDHTGIVFDTPSEFATGTAEKWTWARATEHAEIRASGGGELAACGRDTPCRAWVVYWDAQDWYYAPVGDAALMAALNEAVPALATSLAASTGDDK